MRLGFLCRVEFVRAARLRNVSPRLDLLLLNEFICAANCRYRLLVVFNIELPADSPLHVRSAGTLELLVVGSDDCRQTLYIGIFLSPLRQFRSDLNLRLFINWIKKKADNA